MNEQELRQQIDMFFKGELSDTEEQGLRDYLATHEVPEDFIQEKRIILSLIPDRSVHISRSSGRKIIVIHRSVAR